LTLAPVYGVVATLPRPCGVYRVHGDNNYVDRPLDDARLRDYIGRFETNGSHLAQHLHRVGRVDADPVRWRGTAYNYLWPTRLLATRRHIEALLRPGGTFILVDDGEWGDGSSIADRQGIRPGERNGTYWGSPADDGDAIAAVEALINAGAELLVLWWTCFWWLDAYPRLIEFIDARADRSVDTDAAVIFRLRNREVGRAGADP
jgi:hypothetical protein